MKTWDNDPIASQNYESIDQSRVQPIDPKFDIVDRFVLFCIMGIVLIG